MSCHHRITGHKYGEWTETRIRFPTGHPATPWPTEGQAWAVERCPDTAVPEGLDKDPLFSPHRSPPCLWWGSPSEVEGFVILPSPILVPRLPRFQTPSGPAPSMEGPLLTQDTGCPLPSPPSTSMLFWQAHHRLAPLSCRSRPTDPPGGFPTCFSFPQGSSSHPQK